MRYVLHVPPKNIKPSITKNEPMSERFINAKEDLLLYIIFSFKIAPTIL